jgi:putative endonuclease
MKSKNDWIVYILRCSNRSLYTGITKDINRRLAEHNAGTGAKYTRAHLPCALVWSKGGFSESDAKKEEARIKKLSKKEKENMIS